MISLFRYGPSRWWSPRAWKSWTSYVHWRLETFGVYYPAGRFNRSAFNTLLRQLPSYLRWVSDLDKLRNKTLFTR